MTPKPATPDWFTKYLSRGFKLYRFKHREKGPSGKEAKNWQTNFATEFVPDSNWGAALGVEVEPGKFLVDVDFDWPEGIVLAKRLLSPTSFVYGRASKPISHAFYTTGTPVHIRKYEDIDKKCLVEMRGTKVDGSIGLESMVPPSIHPCGETIDFQLDGEIGHDDNIERNVTLYAIGCLLLRNLGHHGLGHDNRLAMAGFLLAEGLGEDEVIRLGQAIAEASGNDPADVELTVRTTAAKIRSHEHVKGRQTLAKALGDKGKQALVRVREWLGGGTWIEDPKTGRPIANSQENIRRALEQMGAQLTFDTFASRLLIAYKDYTGILNDKYRNRLWLDIERQFRFRPTPDYFDVVIQDIAFEHEYHPVLDYLSELKWDGKKRLDTWLIDYGKAADSAYCRAVGAMVLIAAVRRVRQPGCKFDELLVLESAQGLLKSTALKILCAKEEWFSDDLPLDVDAKQIIERTLGKWFIEAGELAGMRTSQVESLKAMLSRQIDGPVRMAYGRMSVERARQFVCVGTTNAEIYLKDITGNRRFWPVRVDAFNITGLRAVRDQLWAEAAHRESAGDSIRLHPDLYAHAEFQQERRRAEHPWEIRLQERFPKTQKWRLTPDQVWESIGISIDRRDERANEVVLKAMTKLGFRRLTVIAHDESGKALGRVKGFGRDIEEGQTDMEFNDEAEAV